MLRAALEDLALWYGAPRMLQAQAGMARVDIPHLITFAGNLNATDGGSQWPALSGVMRAYGIFDAMDRPFFEMRDLPSDAPLSLDTALPREATHADNIRYASYKATSSGTRTVALTVQDPVGMDKRIGDWDLQVFCQSVPQTRRALGSVRQGDTTVISFAFDSVPDATYILRVIRTVPAESSLVVSPCEFTIGIQ